MVVVELLRTPSYVVPTIAFPAMFFSLFALPYARESATISNTMTLSYIAFAIVGVTLFQFGVGIAAERGRPWERYLRTLPAPIWMRLSARVFAAMLFGLAAATLVGIVAKLFTPNDLSAGQWLEAMLFAAIGAVPFVLLGIAIGYAFNARAALPVANVLYLLMSFGGGLWFPPQALPSFVAAVSPYLPTRQFGELLWSVATPGHAASALLWLAGFSVIFLGLALRGYRLDERARYA